MVSNIHPTYRYIETGKSLLTEMYLNELKNDEQIDLLYHLIVELWYDVADDNMKKCGHPSVAGVDGDVAEFSASKGKIDGMIESLKQIRNMI